MTRMVICMFLSLVLIGCSRKATPIRSQQTDSVRVERHTEYIERVRWDTAYIAVPAQSDRVTVCDSSSHLETDFAASDARINSDGTLFHDLHNKSKRHPVIIPATDTEKTIIRDSIVYRDQQIEVPIRLPLTWWERFWMTSGKIGLGISILLLMIMLFRFKK